MVIGVDQMVGSIQHLPNTLSN